jgi:TctA family transporter
MTYGVPELLKGFDFLIAVIGLFGIGEILLTMEEGLAFKGKSAKISPRWSGRPGRNCRATGRPSCAARPSAAGWASRPAARHRRRS